MKRVVLGLTVWNVATLLGCLSVLLWGGLLGRGLPESALPAFALAMSWLAWLALGPITIGAALLLNRKVKVERVSGLHLLLAAAWPPTALVSLVSMVP